jgi:uncharacterized membrane protein YeaQ/YmgE (transglycosylase-associated protein family)
MGVLATVLLGIVGSFVGGAIAALFTDAELLSFNRSGVIMSIIGAVVALLIYNRVVASRAT